jgi:hypothetical protein
MDLESELDLSVLGKEGNVMSGDGVLGVDPMSLTVDISLSVDQVCLWSRSD